MNIVRLSIVAIVLVFAVLLALGGAVLASQPTMGSTAPLPQGNELGRFRPINPPGGFLQSGAQDSKDVRCPNNEPCGP